MKHDLPPQLSHAQLAGLDGLRITTRHGSAFVAWHGGQLLSWTPHSGQEVLWLSPRLKPLPAALRGGVPVCWPWFAQQGMPAGGAQHGPVRNLAWTLDPVQATDELVQLRLVPPPDAAAAWPPGLQLVQTLTVGANLTQSLLTRNTGATPFALTQALHTYFAVGDAAQVRIDGLQDLRYRDKLQGDSEQLQQQPFRLEHACDRVYNDAGGRYVLSDPVLRRRIVLSSAGSRSVVVWNPGAVQAAAMADVGADQWPHFFCVEVANAGDDCVTLPPGGEHRLTQTLSVEPLGD